MIAFETLESALRAWVKAGSGLADSQVIWQGGPAPEGIYISMRLTTLARFGSDWTKIVVTPAGSGPEVIEEHAIGPRGATLQLRVYGFDMSSGMAGTALLDAVVAAQHLTAVKRAIGVAFGIGVAGDARLFDASRSTLLDPLALIEVAIHLVSDVSAPIGVIRHAHVTFKVDPGDQTISTTWVNALDDDGVPLPDPPDET